MKVVQEAFREILGLFYDDPILAFGLIGWVAFCGSLMKELALPQAVEAPILTIGCITVLLTSVIQKAGRQRSK